MKEQIQEKFKNRFGTDCVVYASAGRINLIGEHTDYNGGFVFPGAIDKYIMAAININGTDKVRVYSMDMDAYCEFGLNEEDAPQEQWARYIFGVCRETIKRGGVVKGFDTVFAGNVPLGAGLSSSAALESCFAFALNDMFNDNKIDKFELAKIGEGYKLVLLNSKVKHELVDSPYNKRRESCERVAAALGVETLRDATYTMLADVRDKISDEDYRRARFVIGEKQRVLDVCDALERGDYETVGRCMFETHDGLSRDYEVSCEELDYLNDVARECGVTGSRIMGGGFGGCTINLVKEDRYDHFIAFAKEKFNAKYGHEPEVINVIISDGAHKVED